MIYLETLLKKRQQSTGYSEESISGIKEVITELK